MNRKFLLISLLLILAYLTSACAGGAGVASSWTGVTVTEDTAYLANGQHIYAVNLANGQEIWRYPEKADPKISFFAPPTLTPDGQVLAGGYNNVLYSLDPQNNGKENWSFQEAKNRYIGSPLAREEGIFAPSADSHLYALDLQGKLRWSFATEDPQWARPASDKDCNCIYLPSMDHHVYSINAGTGEQNWKSEDLGGSVVGTPALSPEGILYAGSFGSQMVAINAQDGKIIWKTPTTGWVWSGPTLHEDRLYFGDLEGAFYALDAKNGSILWQIQPDGPIIESPVITEDSIYFTTEAGTVYSVDFSGKFQELAKFTDSKGNQAKLYAAPVLAGDRLLVAPIGTEAVLVALDRDGNKAWEFIPVKK